MSRPIAVLRPEPGNRVTAIAIEAQGHRTIRLPLFETRPVAWAAPDAAGYDALIVTSANAFRHGGTGLVRLLDLPVWAVGAATAEFARRDGSGDQHPAPRDDRAAVPGARPGRRAAPAAPCAEPGRAPAPRRARRLGARDDGADRG